MREVDFDGGGHLESWSVPNELSIHVEVLRAHPAVDAVVHCHPPSVLVAALVNLPLRPVFGAYNIPATRMASAGVPVWPRSALVRSRELGEQMVAAMGGSPVVVLRGHGITTTGSGEHAVEQAVVRALNLDVLARVCLALRVAGGQPGDLSAEDLDELPDLGSAFQDGFVWRHHVARLRHAGLSLDG